MKIIKWMAGSLAFIFSLMTVMAAFSHATEEKGIEVGRIYYIEGEVFRYVSSDNDWVAVVEDAPIGAEDTFFSGTEGMAEMIVPNGSWIRIGNNTQIQFMALEPDSAEVDVASGVARFYNKGSDTIIKATSSFGYILADPGTVFDFYVGDNSVEVVALKGTVSFVSAASEAKYDVMAGSPSLLADQTAVSLGDGTTDPGWDRWNEIRENIWSAKLKTGGPSTEYLPAGLKYEAHVLDECGRWEMVLYEGKQCWFWRPTEIYAHWSPFTVGIWTEWHGDQTWIPAESFGYVTHHYGNWIYIGNIWYWAPPVLSIGIDTHFLDVGFFWYPGRVSWIYSGIYVGWVPLAPHETYYSRRNWGGPHHVTVADRDVIRINISVSSHAYSARAVIVKQENFFGVKNFKDVRISNIHPTIINNYNMAPVVNNTVIKDYTTNKKRYQYTDAIAKEMPNNAAIDRIQKNEAIIHQGMKENTVAMQRQDGGLRDGEINRGIQIESPKSVQKMSPNYEDKGSRTKRQPVSQTERVATPRPDQQEMPSGQTDRGRGNQNTPQQDRSVSQPDRTVPSGPSGRDVNRADRQERSGSATSKDKTQQKGGQRNPKDTDDPNEEERTAGPEF